MTSFTTQEWRLSWEIADALNAKRPLSEVVAEAYGSLRRLIPVDHAAICVSRPDVPEDYEWFGADLPEDLFVGYSRVIEDDFVRRAAMKRPGVVLCDEEMLPRREVERSRLYRTWHKRGLALEQIMTLMVPIDGAAHGGITLYRGRQRPFTDRDRAHLQQLALTLGSALDRHYLRAALSLNTDRRPPEWFLSLTKRQREVVRLLVDGHDNKFIADELRCDILTVKKHLQRVYSHAGLDGAKQLIANWHRAP